ncbi:MAG: alanine--glyoxylate aminotransferase family protein [Armatimonadetes bacterium]|nr:alanine--glyoxylate aminotransferase family protein [Armatimonadota bacterium]
MQASYGELRPPERVLMGPGPSDVDPRVLRAMSTPLVGHLDPAFLACMDDTMALLRTVFQTQNRFTIPVSATGSAGMEAAFVNVIEPGETAVIGVNGVFGERMCDVAGRCGARVVRVDQEWGKAIPPEAVAEALRGVRPKVVAVVHAETSTGVLQPIEEIARLARAAGALLLVDTVTSLGGVPVTVDAWGADVVYSGTQKCLSCPPGLAPITFSERALAVVRGRSRKVQSWYLDMTMIEKYWSGERVYHHTAPISMIYALREALRLIHEEGLEARFARHRRNHEALAAGLEGMGMRMFAEEAHRLASLNTVCVPEGADDAAVRKRLLEEFGIEIGGGLGPVKGKVWRVGLMGYSSKAANVLALLSALERILGRTGGVAAAAERLRAA